MEPVGQHRSEPILAPRNTGVKPRPPATFSVTIGSRSGELKVLNATMLNPTAPLSVAVFPAISESWHASERKNP